MIRAALALLWAVPVAAQPYVEAGIGAALGGCIYDKNGSTLSSGDPGFTNIHAGCSRNPLGLLAIGYQFSDRWRIQWDHWSSLPDVDRGAEIVSIRYRYTFK